MAGRGSAILIAACLALSGCSQMAGEPEAAPDAEWPGHGNGPDESGFSPLSQINRDNVDELGLAWSLELPGEHTLEATPVMADGKIFFTGTRADIYAVDALTGKLLWKHEAEVHKYIGERMHFIFPLNRGAAYDNGKVFSATTDGRLLALDADSGKLLWSTQTVDPNGKETVTGAPRTFDGKVMIGHGGGDTGSRGHVQAYDQETGKELWKFYVVPGSPEDNAGDPAMERAAETWRGEYWKTGTGGAPWDGLTYDPELDQVYIGTGNSGPYDPEKRSPGGGDNLFTTSIVALNADTGEYIWHYQQNPRDSWDYKATPNMIMATLEIDGEPRDVLMQAPTNGFFYVLDRDTGKLVNKPGKTTVITWASEIDMETGRPVEEEGIRYESGSAKIWPGTVGGHNWQAMSYSPKTGLVYIPIHQIGVEFRRTDEQSDVAFNVMGLIVDPVVEKPGDGKGYLVAWDPVKQEKAWEVQHDVLWNGGVLSTAGDVVFQGTADGWFRAFDGRSGDELWKFNAGLGIIAAPMSYEVDGKQYVSILVGYGGTSAAYGKFMDVGWKYGAQPRRLLTFAIDGKTKLPESPPADLTINAVDDPDLELNEEDVIAGRSLSIMCASCHGVGFYGTGTPGPDLRESELALNLDVFTPYVKGGNPSQGMPPFGQLTDTQLRQIHAYIRARAREAMGKRPPFDPKAAKAASGNAADAPKAGL